MVHAGYMRYREDLIAGGVEIYEFKALRSKQVEARYGKNKISYSDHKWNDRAVSISHVTPVQWSRNN